MKAVILSGGSGQRLLPLTSTITKQLLPVANKPTLFHILDRIKEESSINEVVVVVSQDFGHQVKETLLNSSYSQYFIFDFVFQDKPLGLAHAVQLTSLQIGNEPFIMFLGDILIGKGEVKSAIEKFISGSAESLVFLNEVDDPRPYGVAEVEGDHVTKLVEKPQNPKTNLCLSGIYIFTPSIYFAIANIRPSYRGELEITDAVDFQILRGDKVIYHIIKGFWFDVGTPENMLLANEALLNVLEDKRESLLNNSVKVLGSVQIEKNVVLENVEIIGPVIISSNSIIKHSKIGPYVCIGNNCTIEHSSIEKSIIRNGVNILNTREIISESLLGDNIEIKLPESKKRKYIIGDSTKCISL